MDKSKTKTQILRPTKKAGPKKAGPTDNLSVELLPDKAVGETLRMFVGSPGGTPTEMVLHHGIGVVDVGPDDWILSSPEEVSQLKARSKDPNYPSILAKRTEYIRKEAVKDKILQISDGDVFYFGKTEMKRKDFLDDVKKTITKKHEKEKDYKFIQSLALDEMPQKYEEFVKAEKAYQKWKEPVQANAESAYPQDFRTMKGPLSDIPQEAISWLKAKKLVEVGPLLIKFGVTGPITTTGGSSDDDDYTITSTGQVDQWFFFNVAENQHRGDARKLAKELRKLIGPKTKVIITD
jgi:hypothetical protein